MMNRMERNREDRAVLALLYVPAYIMTIIMEYNIDLEAARSEYMELKKVC